MPDTNSETCSPNFGYYDQALSVYTHISDQLSVFSNQVISCRKHESLYVLSGLLLNDTILQPQFHHTDTGGVTDHIFALCHHGPNAEDRRSAPQLRPNRPGRRPRQGLAAALRTHPATEITTLRGAEGWLRRGSTLRPGPLTVQHRTRATLEPWRKPGKM